MQKDVLKSPIYPLFFQYLFASLGGALISMAYSLIDAIMIGQYEGADGSASLATMMPLWSIIFSLSYLFGIGGAVRMANARGENNYQKGDEYFTSSFILLSATFILIWALFFPFKNQFLSLFGANEHIINFLDKYSFWIILSIPFFMFGQLFSAFIRNDGRPILASAGVISGGIINIVGDYLLIFHFHLGVEGAGIATFLGQLVNFLLMSSHFFSKKRKFHFTKPTFFLSKTKEIIISGFPTFIVDLAAGIMTLLFNQQIMHYYDEDVLAIYGVICNVVMSIQALLYAVGQAIQPLVSTNLGAKQMDRVLKIRNMGYGFSLLLGLILFIITMCIPKEITSLFIKTDEHLSAISPFYMRLYFIQFLFMGFTIFSSFYFQSLLQAKKSILISLLRSIIFSSILVFVLPMIQKDAMFLTMPLSELLSIFVIIGMIIFDKTSKTYQKNQEQNS